MYTLLVAAAVVLTASPVCCWYYGYGNMLVTQSYNGTGVTFVFRPELPEIYAGPLCTAYLRFITFQYDAENSKYQDAYKKFNSSRYDGWTLMKWEPHGLYYYADNIRTIQYDSSTQILHGVDIFNGDQLLYQDSHTLAIYSVTNCVLDGKQSYDNEYKCSQALNGEPMPATTISYPHGDKAGSLVWVVTVPSVVLLLIVLLAIVLIICAKSNRRATRRTWPTTTHSAEDVEQVTDQPSKRISQTTGSPPPYNIALNNSLPDDSAESGPRKPRNFREQPPSYTSVVNG